MATLVHARRNLLTNPSFEINMAGWTFGSTTGSLIPNESGEGNFLRATADATLTSTPYIYTLPQLAVPASGGPLHLQARIRLNEPDLPNARILTQVRFFKAAGGSAGPSYSVTHSPTTAEGWQVVEGSNIVIPPETGSFYVIFYLSSGLNSPGKSFDVDWVMLSDGPEGEYFDGDSADRVESGTNLSLTHEWTGTPHASQSIQYAYAQEPRLEPGIRGGGRKGWRYFATRLHGDGTESLLDVDLPLEDVEVEDVLSGHNAISGSIEPTYLHLLGPDGKPILREYSTAIYAENDGDIRGGGILTHSSIEGSRLSIEAVGFSGYAMDMPYVGSGYKGVRVDPIDAARVIWQHIQNQPGGDIGLEFDDTDTNGEVTIGTELKQVEFDTQEGPVSFESGPYKLNFYTNHDLASDFDDLAAETPFDWHERHYWDADGNLRHRVNIGYPRIGERRENLRFVFGVNIFDPVAVERDGEAYASGTLVLGAGEGASMVRALREPVGRPDGRLRRIKVVVDDSIRSRKKAERRGDQENQWRARLDDIESIVVRDHKNAPLGAVKVGDEIRLEGRGDWTDVDMWVRVLAIAFRPEDGQVAQYTVARTDKMLS